MLPDMQNSNSTINIPINKVGITNIKLPVYISKKDGGQQHTVANIDVFVDLKAEQKGTHMSRLAIGVQKFAEEKLSQHTLNDIADYIIHKCESESCQLIYKFDYFLNKLAPVSKEPGLLCYSVVFDLYKTKEKSEFYISVENTVTSLCPCSKELAKIDGIGGAHNQRNNIKVKCLTDRFVWIEDIIDATNKCGSCEIYSVLKRTDEQSVTISAYNNLLFCEDIVRKAYMEIKKIPGITWFEVETTSEESIHQHGATAKINSKYIE
ncbi:MAG: GTP cyclohydrolase FolE2 [bacterium]